MNTAEHIPIKEVQPAKGEMERDFPVQGKQLIIEFVGPTGAGKTTNCFHFMNAFKGQNLNVHAFSDIKAYLCQLGVYQRSCLYLRALRTNGVNIFSFALLLASNGIYSIESLARYIKLCVFNTALGQFMKTRKVDIVFLDQWAIQGLWSATIFNTRSYASLNKELKRFYFKTWYVLYFDIDDETACERIGSRGTGRSRFDQMEKEKRLAELKRYNHYLHQLFENSECRNKMTFSTKVSPVKNAEDFYRHFEKVITEDIKTI
jgi:thymidylate kinase